jgi:hypothetical protein
VYSDHLRRIPATGCRGTAHWSMCVDLVQRLRAFNRKERFLLVGQALGNPTFALGEGFREDLSCLLRREVPSSAYCAMDYHLDWLYAALMWSCGKAEPGHLTTRTLDSYVKDGEAIEVDLKVTGNQSDVDLLIAWIDTRRRGQVVMIEAKGFSPWHPEQMRYKTARLKAIFGDTGDARFPDVDAHLVLTGPPPEPSHLPKDQWPVWARRSATDTRGEVLPAT